MCLGRRPIGSNTPLVLSHQVIDHDRPRIDAAARKQNVAGDEQLVHRSHLIEDALELRVVARQRFIRGGRPLWHTEARDRSIVAHRSVEHPARLRGAEKQHAAIELVRGGRVVPRAKLVALPFVPELAALPEVHLER